MTGGKITGAEGKAEHRFCFSGAQAGTIEICLFGSSSRLQRTPGQAQEFVGYRAFGESQMPPGSQENGID